MSRRTSLPTALSPIALRIGSFFAQRTVQNSRQGPSNRDSRPHATQVGKALRSLVYMRLDGVNVEAQPYHKRGSPRQA